MKARIQRFLNTLRSQRNFSAHTLRAYAADLGEFERFWRQGKGGDPAGLDRLQIRAYLAGIQGRGLGRNSVLRKISAVRSLVRHLIERDELAKDPFLNIPLPKRERRLPQFLTESEMRLLLDWVADRALSRGSVTEPSGEEMSPPDSVERRPASEAVGAAGEGWVRLRDRAILELLYSSGLRRSELSGLSVSDVDFLGGVVRVLGKGSRERVVPVGKTALKAIREYLKARPEPKEAGRGAPLWLNAKKNRLGDGGVALIVRRSVRSAGLLKRISPHTIRHSFATLLLDGGMDLRMLQEMLGHKNMVTTQIYTHTTLEKLRKVYGKAHPRSGGGDAE